MPGASCSAATPGPGGCSWGRGADLWRALDRHVLTSLPPSRRRRPLARTEAPPRPALCRTTSVASLLELPQLPARCRLMPAPRRHRSPVAARRVVPALRVVLALLLPRPVDACGQPLQYESMQLKGTRKAHYSDRERVWYECRPGYQHLANFTLVSYCHQSKWYPIDEACVRKSCQSPKLENGEVLAPNKTFWFEDEAHFVCDEGYHLVGPKVIVCKHIGGNVDWNDTYPQCKKIYCEPPARIKNGKFSQSHKNMFEYNELVTYSCDPLYGHDEYSLVGESRLICSANGKWSSDPPECKVIICEHPVLENGKSVLTGRKLNYQSVIRFECNPGFHLNGSSLAFCSTNSTWEPTIPTCIPSMNSSFSFGSRSRTTTPVPRHLAAETPHSIPAATPILSRPVIPCKFPVVEHGKSLTAAGLYYGYKDTLEFECSEGYYLKGQRIISCETGGTWKPELPTCVKVSQPSPPPHAPPPSPPPTTAAPASPATVVSQQPVVQCIYPIVENARPITPIKKFYNYKAAVQVECYEGFYLNGDSMISCGAESIWEPELPACVRVPFALSTAAAARRPTAQEPLLPAPASNWTPTLAPAPYHPGYPIIGKSAAYNNTEHIGTGLITLIVLIAIAGILLVITCVDTILLRKSKGTPVHPPSVPLGQSPVPSPSVPLGQSLEPSPSVVLGQSLEPSPSVPLGQSPEPSPSMPPAPIK